MKKALFYLSLLVFSVYSCDSDSLETDPLNGENSNSTEVSQLPNVVKFESSEQLQGFLDEIRGEKVQNLTSDKILKRLGIKGESISLRSSSSQESENTSTFLSLLDLKHNEDLAHLTESDWEIINSDPEGLVYEPEDYVLYDLYLSSVVNDKREIQVGNVVYKYATESIYYVDVKDYCLLANIKENTKPENISDSRISICSPITDEKLPSVKASSNSTLAGTPLTLANGVTIPASNIRDLNYNDRGDANAVSDFFTGLLGAKTVAVNKYSSNRRMLVTFYEQDYLIYKSIGTQAKMQKKVLGIWWNIDAQEIRVGWDVVELKEKLDASFSNIPKPQFIPLSYPNATNPYEKSAPTWMQKDFPFSKDYLFISVPFTDYEARIKGSTALKSGLQQLKSFADKSVKSYMKSKNTTKVPSNMGIFAVSPALEARYVIGSSEDSKTKKSSLEKKFLSEWFGGTYVIGYGTDPFTPTFNFSKFNVNLKGNKTSLGLGSVYGAVKYDNKWLAGRIIKTN
jgi:hypothetical protein